MSVVVCHQGLAQTAVYEELQKNWEMQHLHSSYINRLLSPTHHAQSDIDLLSEHAHRCTRTKRSPQHKKRRCQPSLNKTKGNSASPWYTRKARALLSSATAVAHTFLAWQRGFRRVTCKDKWSGLLPSQNLFKSFNMTTYWLHLAENARSWWQCILKKVIIDEEE